MNVCSLDLCKELYELSGWDDEQFVWFNGAPLHRIALSPDIDYRHLCPAYTLGYLLRKLPNYPPKGPADTNYYDQLFIAKVGNKYEAYYFNRVTHRRAGNALADTPEDAACKLCCELIRQGIIKP